MTDEIDVEYSGLLPVICSSYQGETPINGAETTSTV